MADNKGVFTCAVGTLPASSTKMANTGGYDIGSCIVPTYVSSMPFDPSATGAHYTSTSDYDSGYFVSQDPVGGRVTVSAPSAELSQSISVTR